MENLTTQFEQHAFFLEVLNIIGLVFLVAVVSEATWDFLVGNRKELGETFANSAIGFGNFLLERTVYGLIFVIGLFIATPFAIFDIPFNLWSWGIAILAADFTYYWMHRTEHEVRLLWANHVTHHSSNEYNFSTALRICWLDAVIEWIFFIPMILLGFNLVQVVIALLIVVSYQSWIHTEKIGKLGWLDKVFNTPSVHRVHHGTNEKYIDKNYGGILIIWDRLFGTYQAEEDTVVYGITQPVDSLNPITINFAEYRHILRDIRKSKSAKEAFRYLFKPPGWKP